MVELNEVHKAECELAAASSVAAMPSERPEAVYDRVIRFFCELYQQPKLLMDLLDRVDCRDSNKKFVAYKYRTMFGADIDGPSARHLRWYRRMAPVFSLPRGASILDFGGGYGIDTIFFAALGYQTFLYEITPHQLAIARAFAGRFEERFGKLP